MLSCHDRQGKDYRCGQRAAFAADKIGGKNIACAVSDHDRYGRSVATCMLGGEDIDAWLVSAGGALAYRQYSRAYVDEEGVAKHARPGNLGRRVHASFGDWRAAHR